MGSRAIQGALWGKMPDDWTSIQEKTCNTGYEYVINYLNLNSISNLLDIGCGSGLFCSMISKNGLQITGLDASEQLIEKAKLRAPEITFLTGEMEELPFSDNLFDVVSGFNSFQYAADIGVVLQESKRVLKNKGKLVIMIWGNKEDCEAASYLMAVNSLLPALPPGTPGPFALSENKLLESKVENAGFRIVHLIDIEIEWNYPDKTTAVKGISSAGPISRAIEYCGPEKVQETIELAVRPYIQTSGRVIFKNKFRIVISEKP